MVMCRGKREAEVDNFVCCLFRNKSELCSIKKKILLENNIYFILQFLYQHMTGQVVKVDYCKYIGPLYMSDYMWMTD